MPRTHLVVQMSDLSKKMCWSPAAGFSSHKRGKREVLGRDWCLLIWEQGVPEACLETHLGPQLKHSRNTDKNSYSRCRP